jgi:hypothetical protein
MPTTGDLVMEQFVAAIAARDLQATMALYTPDARFEAHVPGWDVTVDEPRDVSALLDDFLIGRDGFRVQRYRVIGEEDSAALRCDLEWRDADDGAPCQCFQAHFFELEGRSIRFHHMYCAGVRVRRPEEVAQPA